MLKINIHKKLQGIKENMSLDISLDIKKGEFIALSGHSGSGKTTLLRIIAGLEESSGTIIFDGNIWQKDTYKLKPQKRNIGFVFQDYALFENMSIQENLLYVKNDPILANQLLEMTELISIKHLMPSTLSGGQKQRVAICRAMMNNPNLLLLDEPLSALDNTIRKKLQKDILSLHKQFNTTVIMVSHDSSEIYNLASRIITLDNGKIINDGKTQEILLKENDNQNLKFQAELLDIKKIDDINHAIISIGQQLVEIVISNNELKDLTIGDSILVSIKALNPTITKLT